MNAKQIEIISIWTKHTATDTPFKYNVEVLLSPGDSHVDLLDKAFMATNVDNRPHRMEVCSTTEGDLMKLDGQYYLVDDVGFSPVTAEEADKISKLTARETMWGLKDMRKHNLL
jgi:hypothetical protein